MRSIGKRVLVDISGTRNSGETSIGRGELGVRTIIIEVAPVDSAPIGV